jgi:hypothetical protein
MWFTVILGLLSICFVSITLISQKEYIEQHVRCLSATGEPEAVDHAMLDGSEQSEHIVANKSIYMRLKDFTLSFRDFTVSIKDSFTFSFWIVVMIAGLGYPPFLGWMVTGTDALMTTYGFDQGYANNLLLVPNASALIGCFVVGILIDKYGMIQMYFILCGLIYVL